MTVFCLVKDVTDDCNADHNKTSTATIVINYNNSMNSSSHLYYKCYAMF